MQISPASCGLQGQPLALAAANGMLMSGGQDAAVRWWRFDEASAQFQHLVSPASGLQEMHLGQRKVPCLRCCGQFWLHRQSTLSWRSSMITVHAAR